MSFPWRFWRFSAGGVTYWDSNGVAMVATHEVGFKDPSNFEWTFGRTNTETFCCEKRFLFVAMLPLADVSVSGCLHRMEKGTNRNRGILVVTRCKKKMKHANHHTIIINRRVFYWIHRNSELLQLFADTASPTTNWMTGSEPEMAGGRCRRGSPGQKLFLALRQACDALKT